jgi:transcriptional repressor NrdR
MRCPYCSKDNDRVRDTRLVEDGRTVRRRRCCNHCERLFSTFERVEGSLLVIKKDGARENFLRDKIEKGLIRACWKRPVSAEHIKQVAQFAEDRILDEYELEISSGEIGTIVMSLLANLDQVAYVRFASVYREFKDARDFVEELRPILQNRP